MKHIAILALALLAVAPAAAAPVTDPLAPARAGKMMCFFPDTIHKHCRSIGAYVFQPDGTILNPTLSLVSNPPVVIIKSLTRVVIRKNAVCGQLQQRDIERASVTVNGKHATATQAKNAKSLLLHAMSGVAGSPEVCATYEPSGTHMTAHISIAGVVQPDMSEDMVWVDPKDGYIVAP